MVSTVWNKCSVGVGVRVSEMGRCIVTGAGSLGTVGVQIRPVGGHPRTCAFCQPTGRCAAWLMVHSALDL